MRVDAGFVVLVRGILLVSFRICAGFDGGLVAGIYWWKDNSDCFVQELGVEGGCIDF